MSRGLTDPIPEPEPSQSEELDNVIRDIIIGQNKLHDRLVQMEREMDEFAYYLASMKDKTPRPAKKKWNIGL